MEELPTNSNTFKWNEVTTLSKALALIIFIVFPFVGFYLGTQQASPLIIEVPVQVEKETVDMSLPDAYIENKAFKVIAVVQNPFVEETEYDSLSVVTNKGVNDDSCGGMYGPRLCYFFVEEPSGQEYPVRYMASWGNHTGSIDPESIIFTGPNMVEFVTHFGDAGMSATSVWRLDVETGSTTMLREEIKDMHDKVVN